MGVGDEVVVGDADLDGVGIRANVGDAGGGGGMVVATGGAVKDGCGEGSCDVGGSEEVC